ncbi:uncharacterized protein LOC143152659 isoform X2 [Ptiloglossa arizonensis]|uniref:uncharacterized protein LOC143152659 isoform X2 n=1 Tax=Ptiloglossa arizonensis TaxID=3350558 RepID=UPI003F9F3888
MKNLPINVTHELLSFNSRCTRQFRIKRRNCKNQFQETTTQSSRDVFSFSRNCTNTHTCEIITDKLLYASSTRFTVRSNASNCISRKKSFRKPRLPKLEHSRKHRVQISRQYTLDASRVRKIAEIPQRSVHTFHGNFSYAKFMHRSDTILGIAQRTDFEKNKTPPPVISRLRRVSREIDSALRETGREFRRRRSSWDYHDSKPATKATIGGIDDESSLARTSRHAIEMDDIIANTKAKLNHVGSDGNGNFFGPDWFFFVSPNSMEILSKSLYKSSPKNHETETHRKEGHSRSRYRGHPIHGSSNDLWTDGNSDTWNIETSSGANGDKKLIEKQSSLPGLKKHRFSQRRFDSNGEYSDDSRSWPGEHQEIPNEETEHTSRYEIHPARYLEDSRENDDDSTSERSFGSIRYEKYNDRNPSYDESALSNANTLDNVLENRRPEKNKPQFVTDPRSLLAKLEAHIGRTFNGDARNKEYDPISFLDKEPDFDGNVRPSSDTNHEDLYLDRSNDRNAYTGIHGGREFEEPKFREMILRLAKEAIDGRTENPSYERKFHKTGRTDHQEIFESRGYEREAPTDSKLVLVPRVQHDRHPSITGTYEISEPENGDWTFDDDDREHGYLESSEEGLDRANTHGTKNGKKPNDGVINLELNSPRIDESAEIDTRENIHEKYDKHESAAETSIHTHAEANKHGRVKHRESIEEESTSAKEIRDETAKQREPWRSEKHNIPWTENEKRDGIDSVVNTKAEWTPSDTAVEIINRDIPYKESRTEESGGLFSKLVDKLSKEREQVEPSEEKRNRAKDEEYGNQRFVDSAAAGDDQRYKERFSNIGVKNARKGLYVNHRDSSEVPNTDEPTDQSKNLAKGEREIASGQEFSITDQEYTISGNEDKENGKDTLREKWERGDLDDDETLTFELEINLPIEPESANEDETSLADNYSLRNKNHWPEFNNEEEYNNEWNRLNEDKSIEEENRENLEEDSYRAPIETDGTYEENDTTLEDNVYDTRDENREFVTRAENEAESTKKLNTMRDGVTDDVSAEDTASETLRNSGHEDETVRDQTTNLSAIMSAPSVTDFVEDVFPVANSEAQMAEIGDENGAHQSSEADTSEVQSTANVDSDVGASAIIRYGATTGVDNQGKIDTRGSRMDFYESRVANVPTNERIGDSGLNGNEESTRGNEDLGDLRDSKTLERLGHGRIGFGKNTFAKYNEGLVTGVTEENERKRKIGTKSPVPGINAFGEHSEGLVNSVGEESENEREGEAKLRIPDGIDLLEEFSEGLVTGVGEDLENERKVKTKPVGRNGVDALTKHGEGLVGRGNEYENEREVEIKPQVPVGIDALARYDEGLVSDAGEEQKDEDERTRTAGGESSLNWKPRESRVDEILRALNNFEEKKRGNEMANGHRVSLGKESAVDKINENYDSRELPARINKTILPAVESEEESEVSSFGTSPWLEHATKEDESAIRELNRKLDSRKLFVDDMRSIIDKLNSNDLNENDKISTKSKGSAKSAVSWIPEIESKKSAVNVLEESSAATEGRETAQHLNIHISPVESLIKNKLTETQGAESVENGSNLEQLSISYPTSSYEFIGNSDTPRKGRISPATISQGSEEELEKRKTMGQSVVDHLSGRHNFERISHSSLENDERNDKVREENETVPATRNELYSSKLKGRNFEGDSSVGNRVSKLLSNLNGSTQTLQDWENNIFSKKNDIASLAEEESIARRLNAKEAYEGRPGASIETTESNDVSEESEESSSDSLAIKDVSVGGVQVNDVSRTNKYGGHDRSSGKHNETRGAQSNENESAKGDSNLEEWRVISARPLIRDNESDIPNSSNTETSSEAHLRGANGDSILRRLTQGSVSRYNPWTDNERYGGLLTETNRIPEDASSNTEMENHRTKHLPELRSMTGSDEEKELYLVKAHEEEVEASSEKDRNNVSNVKEIEAKDDLENLYGENIDASGSENTFNEGETSYENDYRSDDVPHEERETTESEKENSLSDVSHEDSNHRHRSMERDDIMELLRTDEGLPKTNTELFASDGGSERKSLKGFVDSKGENSASIFREKDNDKLSDDKSYWSSGDYVDKWHDFIPSKGFGEHFYVTPPPEMETQIRRPLDEAEVATTVPSRWKQHTRGNILKKGDETVIQESDDTSHQNLFQGTSRAHTRVTDRDEYSDNSGQSDSTSNINMNSNDDTLQGKYREGEIIQDKSRDGIQSYLKNKEDKDRVLGEANESIESYYKSSNIDGNLPGKYTDLHRSNLKDEDTDREEYRNEMILSPTKEKVDTSGIIGTNAKEEDRDSEGHRGLFGYPKNEEVDTSGVIRTNTKDENRNSEGHHKLFGYPKNEEVDTSDIIGTHTKEEDIDSERRHGLFGYPKNEEVDTSDIIRTNTKDENRNSERYHGLFEYPKTEEVDTSDIIGTNTKEEDRDSEGHHGLFGYPKNEEVDTSGIIRTNAEKEDKDSNDQHGIFRYLKSEGINVGSEIPDSKWSQRIKSDETNDRGSSPTTQSSENLYRPSNEKEESIGTNDYLFYSSRASSSSETGEGISGTKFARKLQPSSWKFAKPATELEYKSEPFVPAPSEPFNPYPDGKGTTEYARPSSSVSSDKVLSSEVTDDDLRTFLTAELSAPSLEDTKSGELTDIYDVSNNGKSSYRSDKTKTDVYIVKRKSKGPVKVTHVEHVKPLRTRTDLIPSGIYQEMRDMYKRNRVLLPVRQRTAGI